MVVHLFLNNNKALDFLPINSIKNGGITIAKNYFRPVDEKVKAESKNQFPDLKLVTIEKEFGGWQEVQKRFFDDGGLFDKIYTPQK